MCAFPRQRKESESLFFPPPSLRKRGLDDDMPRLAFGDLFAPSPDLSLPSPAPAIVPAHEKLPDKPVSSCFGHRKSAAAFLSPSPLRQKVFGRARSAPLFFWGSLCSLW